MRYQAWCEARVPDAVGRNGEDLWAPLLWGTYATREEAQEYVDAQGPNGERNPRDVRRAWIVEVE